MYSLNGQVTADGRQTVPDRGEVMWPIKKFGGLQIQSYHWNSWT